MISRIIVLVSQIKEWMVTAPDFPMRVRWVHVFLIGLISKPCACHDTLIPSLSPRKMLSLSVFPSNKCSFSKAIWASLSCKQISYHMTALLWVNLHFSCIREQFPEGKKKGKKIQLLAAPRFPCKYLEPELPNIMGKKRLYFGRMNINLSDGSEMLSCICFIWRDSQQEEIR